MSTKFIALACVALALLGGITTYVLDRRHHRCVSDAVYVNSDIVCGEQDTIRKTGYTETRNQVLRYIEGQKPKGVTSVSVYFRDLERGPVMGIAELEAFAPASLLKLPLAFVFMNAAETQPEVLTHQVTYTGSSTVAMQREQPRHSAQQGQTYTIESLLRMMLSYSDNASYEVLEQFLHNMPDRMTLRLETFQELGLIDPKDRVETTITVRGYASLLRILFNASYLSIEGSETVLSWLAASDFQRGLVAGVPAEIPVAHKFGERNFEGDLKELHDCGIVYFPNNPYLLCVMTRGTDWQALEETISTISRMMYEEVDSRRL